MTGAKHLWAIAFWMSDLSSVSKPDSWAARFKSAAWPMSIALKRSIIAMSDERVLVFMVARSDTADALSKSVLVPRSCVHSPTTDDMAPNQLRKPHRFQAKH